VALRVVELRRSGPERARDTAPFATGSRAAVGRSIPLSLSAEVSPAGTVSLDRHATYIVVAYLAGAAR